MTCPSGANSVSVAASNNGISFSGLYNFLTWHFDDILVGGLPARAIERLRRVDATRLERLAVLAELQPDAEGILRPSPATPNTDHKEGVRRVGDGIQIGLTEEEIAGVNERLHKLLAEVDKGKEPLF